MNKLAVTIAATAALVVGPVAFAAAQVDAGRITAQAEASASASESESMEPSESAEPTESQSPESAEPTDSPSADHTFTHGLPGALAGSATPGEDFGKYVSGLNRTGAPGAVASVMGKGKGHH